ncbi:hypothetical protein NPX13_g2554 [Xylaria arbuscula]|uniref:Uncharacterized protein n=1 Tax=Xylaria arbuscula TaxID=114810 RepID=A0A9W8NJV2_9PEZI|nr:hypothetical protein NPX13_g2554 [Xylaria arbuscula]
MHFGLLQITLVALAGLTAAAPVTITQDAIEKRLLPAWPYEATRRIPITGNGKRAIPPPYEELYRSVAKSE